MDAKILNLYPVTVGQRQIYVFSAKGPALYLSANGDALNLPPGVYFDSISPCATVSGTYEVRFFPSATDTGRPTWKARWYTVASTEVNSVDLSGEKIQTRATGGNF